MIERDRNYLIGLKSRNIRREIAWINTLYLVNKKLDNKKESAIIVCYVFTFLSSCSSSNTYMLFSHLHLSLFLVVAEYEGLYSGLVSMEKKKYRSFNKGFRGIFSPKKTNLLKQFHCHCQGHHCTKMKFSLKNFFSKHDQLKALKCFRRKFHNIYVTRP